MCPGPLTIDRNRSHVQPDCEVLRSTPPSRPEPTHDHGPRAADVEKSAGSGHGLRGCEPVLIAGERRPLEYRLEQLAGLARYFSRSVKARSRAIHYGLGRPSIEIYASETAFGHGSELALTRRKLRSWAKPHRVSTSLVGQPGKSQIHLDPLGVVLIIGPWNYPLQLVLAPLVGAIAAGNCSIVKPSDVAPTVSSLLAARLPEYVDPDGVQVIQGGVDETTELLSERFDHIFYTGNGKRRAYRHGSGRQAPDAHHARARRQEPVHCRSAD